MSVDKLLTKVFGSSNQRFLKSVQPLVAQINELEPAVKKLSDEQLRNRTAEFKAQVQAAVAGITDHEERKRQLVSLTLGTEFHKFRGLVDGQRDT